MRAKINAGNAQKKEDIIFTRQMRRLSVKSMTYVKTKGKQNAIILAALLFLIGLFTIVNPNFLDKYNMISISQSFTPYAILAIGVTFVIATGGIDLSIGTVCIASATIAGKLYMMGMPIALTIPMMIIIGGIFGLINGILIAKLKMPAFIATLGTMLFARGFSALIVEIPNIFFPTGTWFNKAFSNANGFPIGFIWVAALALIAMYLMYKNKVGRYILSIGSNEEATRLSGIDTTKYKMIAYIISGLCAGIAAIFWAAAFPTVSAAAGNGMELDAIAGVYIGGTSAAGGVASIAGSFIGSILLVVIRTGLNFALAKMGLNLNSQYVTYVITGLIVVGAILMDVAKKKKAQRVRVPLPSEAFANSLRGQVEDINNELDVLMSQKGGDTAVRAKKIIEMKASIISLRAQGKKTKVNLKLEEKKEKEKRKAEKAQKAAADKALKSKVGKPQSGQAVSKSSVAEIKTPIVSTVPKLVEEKVDTLKEDTNIVREDAAKSDIFDKTPKEGKVDSVEVAKKESGEKAENLEKTSKPVATKKAVTNSSTAKSSGATKTNAGKASSTIKKPTPKKPAQIAKKPAPPKK